MSKASDRSPRRFTGSALAVAVALACGSALADMTLEPAPAPREPGEKRAIYQVRCWQKGRLIFDETGIALPQDIAAGAVRLRGRDRLQRPLFVVETVNATCFVKPETMNLPPFGMPGSGR